MNYDVLRFYNVIYQSWLAVHTQQLPSSNRIGGVMVRVLASSVVGRGFEPRSGQTKHNKIGICCFSAKHVVKMEKEQRLVGSESGERVRVGRHVYADCCFSEKAL
jgi:hypothetical protein